MSRAENSGKRLSHADAAIVKGMLLRGDRQHGIAAGLVSMVVGLVK